MKQTSLGTKLLLAALTLGLLAYFGVQGARYFTDPLSTTAAYAYQVEDSVNVSGWMVREELVLPGEGTGLLQLLREEGERLSAGGAVATVYADQASLDRQQEIAALTARIEQLQFAQEAALGVEVTQKLDLQISQSILSYRTALAADQLREAEKQGGALRTQVMKRDFSVSGAGDLGTQLQELQAQRKTLQSQAAGSVRRITAPKAGLYSAVVDGYETVLTPAGLKELTPSALAAVEPAAGAVSNVGKLVLGESWYYAAPMTAAQAEELKEAGGLKLRFAKGGERDLPVTLAFTGPEENGKVVAVFRGNTYLPELTVVRQQSAQILTGAAEGIRVPREALRIVTETVEDKDGNQEEVRRTGVYCVIGREAVFKPVKSVYSTEHFVLVQADVTADQEALRLRPGDEVIVRASGLYDGKVVRK